MIVKRNKLYSNFDTKLIYLKNKFRNSIGADGPVKLNKIELLRKTIKDRNEMYNQFRGGLSLPF